MPEYKLFFCDCESNMKVACWIIRERERERENVCKREKEGERGESKKETPSFGTNHKYEWKNFPLSRPIQMTCE